MQFILHCVEIKIKPTFFPSNSCTRPKNNNNNNKNIAEVKITIKNKKRENEILFVRFQKSQTGICFIIL